MKMERCFAFLLTICLLALTACSSPEDPINTDSMLSPDPITEAAPSVSAEATADAGPYIAAEDDGSGNIIIDTSGITETARYINYESGGSTIQLIAVRASSGEVRICLNTCQACTPSPMAYFIQDGNQFICQNCLNAFATDQLGLEHGGCNPTPIEEKTVSSDQIIIPTAYLDQYSANFANWRGPTE